MTIYRVGIRFTLLLPAICWYSLSCAQTARIDQLKNQLPLLDGSARVDCFNSLSSAYSSALIFDSARAVALNAIMLADKINYDGGSGEGYNNLAAIEYEVSDFAAMENESKKAIGFLKKLEDPKRLGRSYILLGSAIWAQSKFDQAKVEFNKAADLFARESDTVELSNTLGVLALEEEERGNYDASFEYCMRAITPKNNRAYIALGQLYADVGDYETAIECYFKVKDSATTVQRYLKIGEAYFQARKYDSAIYYYRQFINRRGSRSGKMLSKPYALLGSLYLQQGKFDSALFYLKPALNDFAAVNNRNWVMRVLLELGKTYRQTADFELSLKNTRRLLTLSAESGARQYQRDAHYLLSQLFDHLQKRDSAYEHLKKYTTLNNQINIDVSARKLAFYKTTNEREQARLNIDLLTKQKQLQQEELNQTAQQRGFLFIGVLALLLVGTVLVRNILLKKRNEENGRNLAENELRIQKLETKKQLGDLEMQMLRSQMNPHFIFNSLNSINRFILQNDKKLASEYLTKFSRLVRMILQNSQSQLITLEQEIQLLDLYLNLESLRFDHHFSYLIKVDQDADVTMLKVPPLVLQPFCENSVWHGLMHKENKGHLEIDLKVENDLLLARIIDDGVGRAKASALEDKCDPNHKSMGLDITIQRISMAHKRPVQGSVVTIHDLVDQDGKPCGTEVIIKLPVEYD